MQIYLTMGSSGSPQLLNKIINDLLNFEVDIWVATSQKIFIENQKNVIVKNYLPALQLIPRCHLVICNGGSGSVYQALAYLVPVIGVITNMDQAWTMELLEEKNLGIGIRHWNYSHVELKKALRALKIEIKKAGAKK
jgi:UDP:flavonoid glycosyltransferase YjiC (YdhE family)